MSHENKNELVLLASHCEKLINTLTQTILATAEVAANRIEVAANAALLQQRMVALTSVLEASDCSKQTLPARLEKAAGPLRLPLQHELAAVTEQEKAILAKAGVTQPVAQLLPKKTDNCGSDAPGNSHSPARKNVKRPALANGSKNPGARNS